MIKIKGEYSTPQKLYDSLDKEFGFTLDACASKTNAKHKKYYTKEDNSLLKKWDNEIIFMNPPYTRELKLWIKKAYESSKTGSSTVVCLIPASTDTSYWHEYVFPYAEIRYIRGRLQFNNCGSNAKYGSAIVIFRNRTEIYGEPKEEGSP